MTITSIIDNLIILLLLILVYNFIRKTEAWKIFIGLAIVYLMYLLANYFDLEKTAIIFMKIFEWIPVGLIVIFQKELRMMLKKIGGLTEVQNKQEVAVIDEIKKAVFSMSQKKIGALILFDEDNKLTFQSDNRVKIDAECTRSLLETIFFTNSPLHDGAVIIENGRIAYAGCKLPITGKKREDLGTLGTRHLAAIENAELLDLTAIVVSEETGGISVVNNKGLHRIKNEMQFLSFFNEPKFNKKSMFKRKNRKVKKNSDNKSETKS